MPDPASVTSRDDLIRAISIHRATLVAELAAIERFLSSYDDSDDGSVTVQPEPTPVNNHRPKNQTLMMAVLAAVADKPQHKTPMTAVMQELTGNPTGRGIGAYVARGYLARTAKGFYRLTTKGRDKLAQLQA